MSDNMDVEGYRPPDKEWVKMKKVWDTCVEADVDIPAKVVDFFGSEQPSDLGVSVNLCEADGVSAWSADMCQGYEIEIAKLPKDLKFIRVYNSF
jgi:hypothetical protein